MENLAAPATLPNAAGGGNSATDDALLQEEFDNAIMQGAVSIASIYLMDVVNAIQDTKNDPE